MYDPSGNVINDGVNQYLYDAEGRLCAVAAQPIPSFITYTGYLYNAEGQRVAKGNISSWSCNTAATTASGNGFTPTNEYILDQVGNQMTELAVSNGTPAWVHTNVYADGSLIATYLNDNAGPHFRLTDWLGTTRVQTTYAGVSEQTCSSLPFGEDAHCTSATEQFFTGKERDAESGNDYFGARYYASGMGRFMSPDPYSGSMNFANPQSLNRYVYALDNPLIYTDPTGLDCVYYNDAGDKVESVDHHSSSSECGKSGGNWEEGTTDAGLQHYDAKTDTWTGASMDSNNVYIYSGSAPGPEQGGGSYDANGNYINDYRPACWGNYLSGSSTSISNLIGQLQQQGSGGTLYGLLSFAVSQPPSAAVNGFQATTISANYGNTTTGSGWCGSGGYGPPGNANGWSCLAHDYGYSITGNAYPGGNYNPDYSGGPGLQRINQTLCNNVSGFGGFEIKAFFTATVWGCRP